MAIPWTTIVRQVAARVNAIDGATSVQAESSYATSPITTTQIDSARFPYGMIVDACLQAEAAIVHAVANVANHPWREVLRAETADIPNRGSVPAVDSNGLMILGAYGSVRDSADDRILTEAPLEVIERRTRSGQTFFTLPVYFYKINDGRIYHTRPNVKIDVCSYDGDQARADIQANNMIKMPPSSQAAYVAGAVATLVKDEEYIQQAQFYQGLFSEMLSQIATGATSISNNFAPSPQTGSEAI